MPFCPDCLTQYLPSQVHQCPADTTAARLEHSGDRPVHGDHTGCREMDERIRQGMHPADAAMEVHGPRWHRLVDGADAGGRRWFLAGRGVNGGSVVILKARGAELPVSVEYDLDGEPLLYMALGDDVETDDDITYAPRLKCVAQCGKWDRVELRWPDRSGRRRW